MSRQEAEMFDGTLIIPVQGPMRIGYDPAEFIEPPLVTINLDRDGEAIGKVTFEYGQTENSRAREAVLHLSDIHIVITGTAVIEGLSFRDAQIIVRDLS